MSSLLYSNPDHSTVTWVYLKSKDIRGSFLEGPETFSHPENRRKIWNLMETELSYSHLLNMNRGPLHTRSFRLYISLFVDTEWLKMALLVRSFWGFRKTGPRAVSKASERLIANLVMTKKVILSACNWSTQLLFSVTDEPNSQNSLYEAYSHVKTILFFIGYERSRHSLLGALLDAHPHMVVSDESMAFGKWRSNINKWMNSSIYSFYDIMVQTSQRDVAKGKRSQVFEGSVANATSRFKYFVPNQWQGSFDQYIEVRNNLMRNVRYYQSIRPNVCPGNILPF